MDKHSEQHLDNIAKKVFKQSPLESPSKDFTINVMDKINTIPLHKSIVYKPLISKYGWFAIIGILCCISAYIMLNSKGDSSWLNTIDLSIISNNKATEALSSITFSKTLIYTVVLFGMMLLVQIPLLRKYHDKQFSV